MRLSNQDVINATNQILEAYEAYSGINQKATLEGYLAVRHEAMQELAGNIVFAENKTETFHHKTETWTAPATKSEIKNQNKAVDSTPAANESGEEEMPNEPEAEDSKDDFELLKKIKDSWN